MIPNPTESLIAIQYIREYIRIIIIIFDEIPILGSANEEYLKDDIFPVGKMMMDHQLEKVPQLFTMFQVSNSY